MAVQDQATSSVNDTGTNGKIDTPLTQPRSVDVPGIVAGLIAMRNQFGATSRTGYACSNLVEQIEEFRAATGWQRENLAKLIPVQMRQLQRRK